jgi:hypothetical protein
MKTPYELIAVIAILVVLASLGVAVVKGRVDHLFFTGLPALFALAGSVAYARMWNGKR